MRKQELITNLTDGLRVSARKNRKVMRVKDINDRTVAEIVVGKTTIRVNFRDELSNDVQLIALAEGLHVSGRSDTWRGGGVAVTDANYDGVRAVLLAVTSHEAVNATQSFTVRAAIELLEEADRAGELDQEFGEALTALLANAVQREEIKERISTLQHVAFEDVEDLLAR